MILPMKRIPHGILCVLALFAIGISAYAQFTLNVRPVAPGTAELSFTREARYYYCLESSGDLNGTFVPASGWMLGDGLSTTWNLNFPAVPSSGGGGTVTAAENTFSLYPFGNGRTLVTWTDQTDSRFSAIVAQDYSALPPIVIVPGSATTPGTFLLVGRIAWDSAYLALAPALAPRRAASLPHTPPDSQRCHERRHIRRHVRPRSRRGH